MRITLALLTLIGLGTAAGTRTDEPVSYARDVVPFLDEHCIACHDDGFETSDLGVQDVTAMLKGGRHGPAVVPGKGEESLLVQYLTGKKQPQMPPKTSIPLDQVDVIKRWIDQGAKVDDTAAVSARREEVRKQAMAEAAAFSSDAPPAVTSLAYSSDGKRLAAAGYKEVVVVDPETGKTVRRLAGPPDQVASVAFSSDGSLLAAASGVPGQNGEVRIWETAKWAEVAVLKGHADSILAIAWRPNSRQFATAGLDKAIMLWDLDKKAPIRTIRSHADLVSALAFSPDGKRLASGSADKTAKLFDPDTGLQTAGLSTHNDAVLAVAFSPDGKFLATASADRGMALWKLDDLNNPVRGFGHTGPVYALAWRPDSSSLWAGSGGVPSMLSYKRENGERAAPIDEATIPKDWTYAVAVSPDGQTVAAGNWDGTVTLWSLKDGRRQRAFVPGRDDEPAADAAKAP